MATKLCVLLLGFLIHLLTHLVASSSSDNATLGPVTPSMYSSVLYTVSAPVQIASISTSSDSPSVGVGDNISHEDSIEGSNVLPQTHTVRFSRVISTVSELQLNSLSSQLIQPATSISSDRVFTTSQILTSVLSSEPDGPSHSFQHTTTAQTRSSNDFTAASATYTPETGLLLQPSSHDTFVATSTTEMAASSVSNTPLSSSIVVLSSASIVTVASVSPFQTINPSRSDEPLERFSTTGTMHHSEQSSDENESSRLPLTASSNGDVVPYSNAPSHYADTDQPSIYSSVWSVNSMTLLAPSSEQSVDPIQQTSLPRLSTLSSHASIYPTHETHVLSASAFSSELTSQQSETDSTQTISRENVRSEVSSFSQLLLSVISTPEISLSSFTQPLSTDYSSDISETRYSSYLNSPSESSPFIVDTILSDSFSRIGAESMTQFLATTSNINLTSSLNESMVKATANLGFSSVSAVFPSTSNTENDSVTSQFLTSVDRENTNLPATDFIQLSSSTIVKLPEYSSLDVSTSASSDNIGLVQMLTSLYDSGYSSEMYSSPIAFSIEHTSDTHYSTACNQCVTETTHGALRSNGFSIQPGSTYTFSSESSVLDQTTPLSSGDSWNPSVSLSGNSKSSTPISTTLVDASTLGLIESIEFPDNHSVPVSFSLPSPSSSQIEDFLTSVQQTSDDMSTFILSTQIPDSTYYRNITISYSLKGDCDLVISNDYLSRKFWRALLRHTEKASNTSTRQQGISLLDLKCDPFRAVVSVSVTNETDVIQNINNYFNSNASHSTFSLRLNNGTTMVLTITHYEFTPSISNGHRPSDKASLSEIVVISTASVICGILVTFGAIVTIREYLDKRKSERFRFPFSGFAKGERVALRSFPRTGDTRGSALEMQDCGSLSGSRSSNFDGDYSTVGSQKGRKTDFMTQSDMNSSRRSRKKNRSTSKKTGQGLISSSSNGTPSSQSSRGYGLVIGLLGYKNISKEPTHIYAVPNKKAKIQGLSIRNKEESFTEMPTLARDDSRRTVQAPDGSPTPPPRHLRTVSKNKNTTDSVEKLVPSKEKEQDFTTDGVTNPAYKDDPESNGTTIGSTLSVHI